MDPTRVLCRADAVGTPEFTRDIIENNIVKIEHRGPYNTGADRSQSRGIISVDSQPVDTFYLGDLSPFKNLSAYDLASIDTYFDILGHSSGGLTPQVLRFQSFALSGKNLGYLEYIQYRNPLTFIHIFDKITTNEIKDTLIVYERLNQIFGVPIEDASWYRQRVTDINSAGVDVTIIDGYHNLQELCRVLIIMLSILKNDGNMILRVNLSLDEMRDFIEVLLVAFDHGYLFKPATTDGYSPEYFFIYKGYISSKYNQIGTLLNRYLLSQKRIIDKRSSHIDSYINSRIGNVNQELSRGGVYTEDKLKFYLNIQ
jgi:hypothetical protein